MRKVLYRDAVHLEVSVVSISRSLRIRGGREPSNLNLCDADCLDAELTFSRDSKIAAYGLIAPLAVTWYLATLTAHRPKTGAIKSGFHIPSVGHLQRSVPIYSVL